MQGIQILPWTALQLARMQSLLSKGSCRVLKFGIVHIRKGSLSQRIGLFLATRPCRSAWIFRGQDVENPLDERALLMTCKSTFSSSDAFLLDAGNLPNIWMHGPDKCGPDCRAHGFSANISHASAAQAHFAREAWLSLCRTRLMRRESGPEDFFWCCCFRSLVIYHERFLLRARITFWTILKLAETSGSLDHFMRLPDDYRVFFMVLIHRSGVRPLRNSASQQAGSSCSLCRAQSCPFYFLEF